MVKVTGDDERFQTSYRAATRSNVIEFLTFDAANPNSISCLTRARENARSVREIISSEMWEEINRFYLFLREAGRAAARHVGRARVLPTRPPLQPPDRRHEERDDGARRGMALQPHRTVHRARRPDDPHPRREVLPAAAVGGRRRQADRRPAVGGPAPLGERLRSLSPDARPGGRAGGGQLPPAQPRVSAIGASLRQRGPDLAARGNGNTDPPLRERGRTSARPTRRGARLY